MMKKIMIIVVGILVSVTTLSAKDYKGHWAEKPIEKWYEEGIIQGQGEGIFKPNDEITRAELATFIQRLFQFESSDNERVYTDIVKDSWYEASVLNVTSQGIMYTPGSAFLPAQPVTRQEVAYALAKAYRLQALEEKPLVFKDDKEVALWAKEGVQALTQEGHLKGYPDGTFKPTHTITRAEFIQLVDQLIGTYIAIPSRHTIETKQNVVIQSGGVTLENTIINGDVYITPGVGEEEVVFENVEVTGCVYVMGGKVSLNGIFNAIEIQSTMPFDFKKGEAYQISIIKDNTVVTLHKDTTTHNLVIGGKGQLNVYGSVEKSTTGEGEALKIEGASVVVDGQYVPIKVEEEIITLNLYDLIQRSTGDCLDAIIIYTNGEADYLEGYGYNKLYANQAYTFKAADEALGMLEDMIEQIQVSHPELRNLMNLVGVTPNTAYSLLTRDGETFSLRYMLSQYENVKTMIRQYTGVQIGESFDFSRRLYRAGQSSKAVVIRLEIK